MKNRASSFQELSSLFLILLISEHKFKEMEFQISLRGNFLVAFDRNGLKYFSQNIFCFAK